MARASKKVSSAVMADVTKLMAGKEPEASLVNYKNKDYKQRLITMLNWYTSARTSKDAVKYLETWMKSNKFSKEAIDAVQRYNGLTWDTTGWLARMMTRGATLSQEHRNQIEQKIAVAVERMKSVAAPEEAVKGPVKSIQDHMREKTQELLGELEGDFDSWNAGEDGFEYAEGAYYNVLVARNTPKAYTDAIVAWADSKLKEFGTVLLTKDKEIKEGYSNFSKKQLGEVIKWFNGVKISAQKYADFKKVQKAPRKRKEKPASVVAAKMKYMALSDTYGKGLHPVELVGAQQAWLFNVKTRALSVYNATGATGLTMKGSTLYNYDPETSKVKRLRANKAEALVKELRDAGKVALRKFMAGVKATEYDATGRVNKDTLIVRVTK